MILNRFFLHLRTRAGTQETPPGLGCTVHCKNLGSLALATKYQKPYRFTYISRDCPSYWVLLTEPSRRDVPGRWGLRALGGASWPPRVERQILLQGAPKR